jgi:3-oxoacyl-[acyl-carrier-protein] synthase-3
MPNRARGAIHAALETAGLTPSDVDFYASHQAAAWFRPLTQKAAGLTRARSFDTFPLTGTLSAANIPMVLHEGRRRGLLHEGDVIATFAGGNGETWAAMVLRWGR